MSYYSEVLGKHEELKKGLLSSFNGLAEMAFGMPLSAVAQEAQATEREHTLFEAGGKSKMDMLNIEATSTNIIELNPNLKTDQAYSLIAKADLVHAKNGMQYAEKAGMLKYTTRLSEDEAMKMMASTEFVTGNEDMGKAADVVQFMSNRGGGAVSAKFVESVSHFDALNSKLLTTPEKLGNTFISMGKLLNDFKTYRSLQENTMNMIDNGELASILEKHYADQNKKGLKVKDPKAKAAEEIKKLSRDISSGEKETINIALAKLMMTFSSIKDKETQNTAFDQLGINSKDAVMSNGLKEVRDITTGAFVPPQDKVKEYQVENGAANAHALSAQNDAYFKQSQAQALAKNEAIETMNQYTENMSWFTTGVSNATTGVLSWFNSLDEWTKNMALLAGGVLFLADDLNIHGTSRLKQFRSLWTTMGGTSKGKDTDAGGSHSTPGRNKCCCCEEKKSKSDSSSKDSGSKSSSGKRSMSKMIDQLRDKAIEKLKNQWNRLYQGKIKGGLTKGLDWFGASKNKIVEKFKSETLPNMKRGLTKGREWLGSGKNKAWKVPYQGTLQNLQNIINSENKLDTLARLGVVGLGGWIGTRVGAAIGGAGGSLISPGAGSVIGGVAGGVSGNIGGQAAGGAFYDWIKSFWQEKPPVQTSTLVGPPMPNRSPISTSAAKQQPVSINIPQITVPLHVQGVLQDIPTMLKMLSDPSVAQRIKDIIERSLLDALETRGGIPT